MRLRSLVAKVLPVRPGPVSAQELVTRFARTAAKVSSDLARSPQARTVTAELRQRAIQNGEPDRKLSFAWSLARGTLTVKATWVESGEADRPDEFLSGTYGPGLRPVGDLAKESSRLEASELEKVFTKLWKSGQRAIAG